MHLYLTYLLYLNLTALVFVCIRKTIGDKHKTNAYLNCLYFFFQFLQKKIYFTKHTVHIYKFKKVHKKVKEKGNNKI